MEEKKDESTFLGCLSGLLIFGAIIGFNMFMFWLCGQIFGWNL